MDTEYKIIGGDGAEYGPAPLAELKSWIRDGRVAAMTKVWRSDLLDWSAADRYTELRDELAIQRATVNAAAARAMPAAGFWPRLAAYIIDHILLAIILLAVWIPIANAKHWQMPEWPQTFNDASFEQFRIAFNLFISRASPFFYPIIFLYDVLFNGRFGATPGKMAIGAKITTVDGQPIGYWRAALRWLAMRICDFFLCVGYLLIAFRRDKRGLHDLLAGTKVVFKR
jgi:uncharacterized RDD family membrane protein YckC